MEGSFLFTIPRHKSFSTCASANNTTHSLTLTIFSVTITGSLRFSMEKLSPLTVEAMIGEPTWTSLGAVLSMPPSLASTGNKVGWS